MNIEERIKEIHLKNLGVETTDEINDWFRKSYDNGYNIPQLKDAVAIIKKHPADAPVAIFGDYDVDGIMASSIAFMVLRSFGFKNVSVRLPHRFSEGFGLKKPMVKELEAPGRTLIITVDNGIAAHEAVDYAKSLGATVIVTDHHCPVVIDGETVLPKADCIVDPMAVSGSDFNGYCGAGIAYKLGLELIGRRAEGLISLAAIATIADVMPLVEENYVLVKNGLKALSAGNTTLGLKTLCKMQNVGGDISASDIGFKIAPCLNAPGRLIDDGAIISMKTVVAGNQDMADEFCRNIIELNEQRKSMVNTIMQNLPEFDDEKFPVIVHIPHISEGVIGILAGKLCEQLRGPAIVFTDAENGILKGSGRSPENVNLKELLDKVPELFEGYGGHAGAAGMSIKPENLEMLKKRLQTELAGFKPEAEATETPDIEIEASQVQRALEVSKMFAPFGEGNPPLLVKVTDISLIPSYGKYKHLIGVNGLKFYSNEFKLIGFGIEVEENEPTLVDAIGYISENFYNGMVTTQIEVKKVKVKESLDKVNFNNNFFT